VLAVDHANNANDRMAEAPNLACKLVPLAAEQTCYPPCVKA